MIVEYCCSKKKINFQPILKLEYNGKLSSKFLDSVKHGAL